MKPAAQLLALAGLLVLAGCGVGTGTEAHAVAEVGRWDRAADWIVCSEATVHDSVSTVSGRYYVVRAECTIVSGPLRGQGKATTYFRVSFHRHSFGGWELAGIRWHPDASPPMQLERHRVFDRASPVQQYVWRVMVRVTLSVVLVCAAMLGGALLWHRRRR